MLRSRRRASSNPAPSRPASASASLAATKAFLRDRESNGALSSAAAAAALRTHTTTPTPVGDTVTKRMVRKGSLSSQGSGSQQRPGLRRHSSSGSMTERSFRAPSPSRSSPVDHHAPPVPPVPKNVPQEAAVQRRNSSLEPPVRGGSPVGRGGGRGVSLDRGTSSASNRGRGQPRASPLSKVVEDDHDAGQRSSINFSRPISPPVGPSPAPRPVASARGGQSGWFGGPVVNTEQTFRGAKPRPKTSDGFSAQATQQALQNAADRPVSSRTAHMSSGVEGARLASGSMRAKPTGAAVQAQPTHTAASDRPVRIVDPNSPFAVYDPSSRKFIHKQDAMNLHRAMSDAEDPAPPYEPQQALQHAHHETPQYRQPARQAPQPRNIVQQPVSASPIRDAPQRTDYTRQSAAAEPAPAASRTHHDVGPQDAPVAFTDQEFAEPEDRTPAEANTGRKLELSTQEPLDGPEETTSPKLAPNQDSSYPRLAPPDSRTPSGPPSSQGSERISRTHSLSPPRNAHFAAVAVEFPNGVKHQPPARSVSPAKSALKASPSVSGRNHSPLADVRNVDRGAPSEVSDAVSEDGGKKKKKVRISFEEEPTVVGTSAYGANDTSNVPIADDLDSEEDLDDILKPTPVLPSFGSIRDKNRRSRDEEVPEKVTETVSSSMSNSATLMGDSTDLSSDHKIGGILAQDFAAKSREQPSGNEPLPPEVTSVEGSGYYSDSSSEASVTLNADRPGGSPRTEVSQSTPEPEPKTLTIPIDTRPASSEIPLIAVQPASPPLPQETTTQSTPIAQPITRAPRPFVPGGWDDDDVSEPETEAQQPEPAISTPSQPSITIQIPERPVDDDSSDDNSSVYSDAYEDLEEGEGFGSIDAIMESPIVAPTSRFASNNSSPTAHRTGLEKSRWAPTDPDDIQQGAIQEQREGQSDASWERSQQYWSEVNDSRKQQPQSGLLANKLVEREEAKNAAPVSAPFEQTKVKAERSVPTQPQSASSKSMERGVKVEPTVAQAQASSTQPVKAPAQPRKSALKKTTPTSPPAESPMKKTMRDRAPVSNGTESQMRTTMRGAGGGFAGRGAQAPAAQRQSMPPMDTKPPRGALQKKHLPTAAAGAAARPRPQSASGVPSKTKAFVPPVPTYESDSDASVSSFQRERQRKRSSRNSNGQYTMRTSMRSGPTPTMRAAPPVRSISPPRNATSPPPSTLRKSMRPSSPRPESPDGVKSSRFSIRSLSPAGRFRRKSTFESAPPMPPPPVQAPPQKAKKSIFGKSTPAKAPARPSKPFRSRVNDSSDEEDDQPRRFQSRFADSDSEDDDYELPPGLTPVRGIPKRPGEEDGDSTDLEDEASDDEATPAPATNGNGKGKVASTNGVNNTQGANFAAGSLRKPGGLLSLDAGQKKPKRGLFGFGKKKKTSYIDADSNTQNATDFDIPMPPAQHNRDRNRPLTPIGEDRDADAGVATRKPPTAGRREPLERSTSDSWPLPSPDPAFAQDQRPQSADGPVKRRLSTGRPTLVKRNSSQISQARTDIGPKSGKEVSFGRNGKKKKFQGLRRVLGLND